MTTKRRFTLDVAGKAMVLTMIVMLFCVMMVPIYQIGRNHEYRLRISQAQQRIQTLDELERTLESEISYAQSPEALIDNVVEYFLSYDEIDSSRTVMVARSLT